MAKRKLPVILLVTALLSLALAPASLACKRHHRKYHRIVAYHCVRVHHRVVHHYVACVRHKHYRAYKSITAEPYIVSHDVAAWVIPPTPAPAVAVAPPSPQPLLPLPEFPPAQVCCVQCPPQPCPEPCPAPCSPCRHGRHR